MLGDVVSVFKYLFISISFVSLCAQADNEIEINVINSPSNINRFNYDVKMFQSKIISLIPMNDIMQIEIPDSDHVQGTLRKATQALLMKESGSVIFTGPPGVGKSYQMSLLLAYINKFGPNELKRRMYFMATASNFGARKDGNAGEVEEGLQKIIALSHTVPVTIVVDELHALQGQGTHRHTSIDVLEHFKEALASGRIKLIGTTTDFEFEHFFGARPALMQRFVKVNIASPTEKELRSIIRTRYNRESDFNVISDEVLDLILQTSKVFGGTFAEPRRSIKIVDYIVSNEKIDNKHLNTRDAVIPFLSDYYNMDLDVFLNDQKLSNLIQEAKSKLTENFIGLDDSINQFLKSFYFWSKQKNRGKPLSVLVYGSKGTGKTYFSSKVAESLGFKYLKISMQNIEPQDLLSRISTQLEMYPFTFFLLDELDKASIEAQRALLGILDSSEMTTPKFLSTGERMGVASVSMKNSVFMMTTNAGQDISQKDYSSNEALESIASQGLIDVYLLDRMQKAIAFKTPELDELKVLIQAQWNRIVDLMDSPEELVNENMDDVVNFILDKVNNNKGISKSLRMGFMPHGKDAKDKLESVSIRFIKKELELLAEDILVYNRMGFLNSTPTKSCEDLLR